MVVRKLSRTHTRYCQTLFWWFYSMDIVCCDRHTFNVKICLICWHGYFLINIQNYNVARHLIKNSWNYSNTLAKNCKTLCAAANMCEYNSKRKSECGSFGDSLCVRSTRRQDYHRIFITFTWRGVCGDDSERGSWPGGAAHCPGRGEWHPIKVTKMEPPGSSPWPKCQR